MYPSAIGLDDEPLYSEPDDEVRPSGDAAPRANDRRPRQDRERLPDRAVLVVDDDDDFREVLIDRLAAEGIPVVGASSATEALALAQRFRPAALLTDIRLPDQNGTELAAAIRCDPRLSSLPIFYMTAAHNRCMGLGGPVFLKPINIDSLLRGLRWYLN